MHSIVSVVTVAFAIIVNLVSTAVIHTSDTSDAETPCFSICKRSPTEIELPIKLLYSQSASCPYTADCSNISDTSIPARMIECSSNGEQQKITCDFALDGRDDGAFLASELHPEAFRVLSNVESNSGLEIVTNKPEALFWGKDPSRRGDEQKPAKKLRKKRARKTSECQCQKIYVPRRGGKKGLKKEESTESGRKMGSLEIGSQIKGNDEQEPKMLPETTDISEKSATTQEATVTPEEYFFDKFSNLTNIYKNSGGTSTTIGSEVDGNIDGVFRTDKTRTEGSTETSEEKHLAAFRTDKTRMEGSTETSGENLLPAFRTDNTRMEITTETSEGKHLAALRTDKTRLEGSTETNKESFLFDDHNPMPQNQRKLRTSLENATENNLVDLTVTPSTNLQFLTDVPGKPTEGYGENLKPKLMPWKRAQSHRRGSGAMKMRKKKNKKTSDCYHLVIEY